MTLEELKERAGLLETNINQITQNLYTLHGHKAEVQYQISELEKPQTVALEEQPETQELEVQVPEEEIVIEQ